MNTRKLGGFIIGAPKAATSAAIHGLSTHPLIAVQSLREMNYFQHGDLYAAGWDAAVSRFFPDDARPFLLGKNVGVMYSETALQRLRDHDPAMQVFLFLREPIKRAYSAFWFARRQGWEPCASFEEALRAPASRFDGTQQQGHGGDYLERGCYADFLPHIQKLFPGERLTVYLTDDLRNDMTGVLREIARKTCGEDVTEWNPLLNRENSAGAARSQMLARATVKRFPGRTLLRKLIPGKMRDSLRSGIQKVNSTNFNQPEMDPETFDRLCEYYREPNKRLAILLERDLSEWPS